MSPHILLLTSSSRNFPLEMQDVLNGAKLESTRLATLAEFIASPLRQEPFLAVLEIGNLEDIDRALLAFEWAESVQPLAPARFLLLIGSKHLSLGEKASRFRGAEVAQLPLPPRNILFKLDLQLKLLSNHSTKPREARGFVPQPSAPAEKERVLVFKGPGPQAGAWQAGENSPQGKVRWRWVDTKPKIVAAAELTWVVESKSPPHFEEALQVWKVTEPEADLKCLNETGEIFSALASEKVLRNQPPLAGETQSSNRKESSLDREILVIDLGEGVGERQEGAVSFQLGGEAEREDVSTRGEERENVGSLGALKLSEETQSLEFFGGPDAPKEKTKEIFLDSSFKPQIKHGEAESLAAPNSLTLKRKTGETAASGEPLSRESPRDTLAREISLRPAKAIERKPGHSLAENIDSLVTSPASSAQARGSGVVESSRATPLERPAAPEPAENAPRPGALKLNSPAQENSPGPSRLPLEPAARPARVGASAEKVEREVERRAPVKGSSQFNASRVRAPGGQPTELGEPAPRARPADNQEENLEHSPRASAPDEQKSAPDLKPTSPPGTSSAADSSFPERPGSIFGNPPVAEGERIVLGGASNSPYPQIISLANGAPGREGRSLAREDVAQAQHSPDHYLKMRHFLTMTLEELQDKNSSWYPVDGYRIYLSAHHRYYGFSRPEELFPLWIYEGELAPEFLDSQKAWKFYDRLPIPHTGLAGLPDSIMRYLSVTIGAHQAEGGGDARAKREPLAATGATVAPVQEEPGFQLLLNAKKPSGKRPWREKFQRFIRKALGMKVD